MTSCAENTATYERNGKTPHAANRATYEPINSNSNNFIQNKKLHASFLERHIIYHKFNKVNVSDLRRTGARNSASFF